MNYLLTPVKLIGKVDRCNNEVGVLLSLNSIAFRSLTILNAWHYAALFSFLIEFSYA